VSVVRVRAGEPEYNGCKNITSYSLLYFVKKYS